MSIESIEISKILSTLRGLKSQLSVSSGYHQQLGQIKLLLRNDTTGFVNTILDFMIHAASVPMKIETKINSLDSNLKVWQKLILNKDINIDIPRGLRELSAQYFRERWTSSFIVLNINWDNIKFGQDTWELPSEMYFSDGCSVYVESPNDSLDNTKYYIGQTKKKQLTNNQNRSVIIRKPYGCWYDKYPVPFLVRRGVLFNALLKEMILSKQADVVEQIIPYLLLLNSGTDKLAEIGALAGEDQLRTFKDSLVQAIKEHDITGEFGKLIASLSYDTKLEHFIPDLMKILHPDLAKSCDKNILAGMGMIELNGFSKNREETILNPKILVEEVRDAVSDWALLLEEVLFQIAERNQDKYRANPETIKVVPEKIKAFITDAYRTMIVSLFNKGLIPYQNTIEDIGDYEFEAILERKRKENKENLEEVFYPPVIQNMDNGLNDFGKDNIPTTSPDTAPSKNSDKKQVIKQKAETIETEDYIRIRQREPEDFQEDSFKTIILSDKKNIKAVIGKLKNETALRIQSYLFLKTDWTIKKAEKWVKINASEDEKTEN